MNDTTYITVTGGFLLLAALIAFIGAVVFLFWIMRNVFPVTTVEQIVQGIFIGVPFAIVIALGVCAFTVGTAPFRETYETQSTDDILPVRAGDWLGSPFMTLSESGAVASITTRDSDGVLNEQHIQLDRIGLFANEEGKYGTIVDDATDQTVRIEIESCTLVSDTGAQAIEAECQSRSTIHIPRIEAVAP